MDLPSYFSPDQINRELTVAGVQQLSCTVSFFYKAQSRGEEDRRGD